MAKQPEIKFRDRGGFLEGRRGNLTFAIYDDNLWKDQRKKTCSVVVRHKDIESLGFNTAGHRHFTLEGAKEFCQKIATGEIDPEAMLAEFAAEDMAREQAAIRDVTEALVFRHRHRGTPGIPVTQVLKLIPGGPCLRLPLLLQTAPSFPRILPVPARFLITI